MAKKRVITPPVAKCHGGKHYLKWWILENAPADYHKLKYLEPYCGLASVGLNKEKSEVEWLADADPWIIALLSTIKDNVAEFMKRLRKLKYTQATFDKAVKVKAKGSRPSMLEAAIVEYTLRRMSRGGLKKSFAIGTRLRGGQPGDINAWVNGIGNLPAISGRMEGMTITWMTAIGALKSAKKGWFVYLDPPYLKITRTAKAAYGEFEMTPEQHEELLDACLAASKRGAKILLSGYPSEMYDTKLKGWRRVEKLTVNQSGQGKVKQPRTEVLWANY